MNKEQLQAALIKAGQVISSALDLNDILNSLNDEIKTLLEATGVSFLLLDLWTGKLIFEAMVVPDNQTLSGDRSLPPGRGIAGWVVQNRQSELVDDAQQDSRFCHDIDDLTGVITHSLLAVPILFNERVIGVIEVINKTKGNFNQQDLEALETLASSAAIAIENARLHEFNRAITASLRLTDVYHSFSHHTARLFPYDRLSITRLEKDIIHVVHIRTRDEKNFLPANISLPCKGSAAGFAISRGQPWLRHDLPTDTSFADDAILAKLGIRSSLIVPLRVKGQIIGTWDLGSRQIGAYQADDLKMVQVMADQLAIAIENARLFEQVQIDQEQLRLKAQQIVFAQEEERWRLSRKLRDEVGKMLTDLKTGLICQANLPIEVLQRRMREAADLTDTIIESLRVLAKDLHSPAFDQLSPREREVHKLIVDGETNKTIAKMLNISDKTVEKHRDNLMKKLDVHNLAELVRLTQDHQLISSDEQRLTFPQS